MNKIFILSILLPFVFGFTDSEREMLEQQYVQELENRGLMKPDSGVKLVPRANLMLSDSQKKKDILSENQQNELGYVKEDSPRATELLNFTQFMKERAPIEAKMYRPFETHLRKSTNDMIMAYMYIGVPPSEMKEYIGIAPAGTYVQTPVTGWSGAVQFFNNNIGTCAYTENNLHISHGAARIAEEDARFDVNAKITLVDITGTDKSGYLYRVKWFDESYIRELECANLKYSANTTHEVIALANRIDLN